MLPWSGVARTCAPCLASSLGSSPLTRQRRTCEEALRVQGSSWGPDGGQTDAENWCFSTPVRVHAWLPEPTTTSRKTRCNTLCERGATTIRPESVAWSTPERNRSHGTTPTSFRCELVSWNGGSRSGRGERVPPQLMRRQVEETLWAILRQPTSPLA